MKRSDYRCEDCGKVFEVWIQYGEEFPEHPQCEHCKSSHTYKKFGAVLTDVAIGQHGNSETGYGKEPVYHCSKFGKFKNI